jgi:hypothetical protein
VTSRPASSCAKIDGMRWEGLFADLEAQAAALAQAERAAEVEERTRGELAALHLTDRLRAGMDGAVRLRLSGGRIVSGRLRRVGPDWLLVAEEAEVEALVRLGAVLGVRGLSRYSAVPGAGDAISSRLGLRSVLRGIARDRSPVRLELTDGATVDATIDRVGADFMEAATHGPGELRRRQEVRAVELVPFAAVAAVRRRG